MNILLAIFGIIAGAGASPMMNGAPTQIIDGPMGMRVAPVIPDTALMRPEDVVFPPPLVQCNGHSIHGPDYCFSKVLLPIALVQIYNDGYRTWGFPPVPGGPLVQLYEGPFLVGDGSLEPYIDPRMRIPYSGSIEMYPSPQMAPPALGNSAVISQGMPPRPSMENSMHNAMSSHNAIVSNSGGPLIPKSHAVMDGAGRRSRSLWVPPEKERTSKQNKKSQKPRARQRKTADQPSVAARAPAVSKNSQSDSSKDAFPSEVRDTANDATEMEPKNVAENQVADVENLTADSAVASQKETINAPKFERVHPSALAEEQWSTVRRKKGLKVSFLPDLAEPTLVDADDTKVKSDQNPAVTKSSQDTEIVDERTIVASKQPRKQKKRKNQKPASSTSAPSADNAEEMKFLEAQAKIVADEVAATVNPETSADEGGPVKYEAADFVVHDIVNNLKRHTATLGVDLPAVLLSSQFVDSIRSDLAQGPHSEVTSVNFFIVQFRVYEVLLPQIKQSLQKASYFQNQLSLDLLVKDVSIETMRDVASNFERTISFPHVALLMYQNFEEELPTEIINGKYADSLTSELRAINKSILETFRCLKFVKQLGNDLGLVLAPFTRKAKILRIPQMKPISALLLLQSTKISWRNGPFEFLEIWKSNAFLQKVEAAFIEIDFESVDTTTLNLKNYVIYQMMLLDSVVPIAMERLTKVKQHVERMVTAKNDSTRAGNPKKEALFSVTQKVVNGKMQELAMLMTPLKDFFDNLEAMSFIEMDMLLPQNFNAEKTKYSVMFDLHTELIATAKENFNN